MIRLEIEAFITGDMAPRNAFLPRNNIETRVELDGRYSNSDLPDTGPFARCGLVPRGTLSEAAWVSAPVSQGHSSSDSANQAGSAGMSTRSPLAGSGNEMVGKQNS